MAQTPNFDKEIYRGRCAEIALALAPNYKKMIERRPKNGPCPKCGGKDRARCFDDFNETGGVYCNQCAQKGCSDLIGFLSWANDWSRIKASKEVKTYLIKFKEYSDSKESNNIKNSSSSNSKNTKKNKRIWNEAKNDSGIIKEYLKHRGLSGLVPKGIRLHSNLSFYEINNKKIKDHGNYPAMISPIMNGRKLVGIHKTWLNKDGKGKIPFEGSKKTGKIGSTISGGVIKLFPIETGKPLVIAEGIETAIAVHEATGWPCWACVTAINFQKIKIPQNVKLIYLAVDLDKSGTGERESEKLARKLLKESRQVFLVVPSGPISENEKSLDWLDVLKKEGRKTVKNSFLKSEPWRPVKLLEKSISSQTQNITQPEKTSPAQIASHIYQAYDQKLIYSANKFFIYSKGFWGEIDVGEIRKFITNLQQSEATGPRTDSTLKVLKDQCWHKEILPNKELIGFLNGDLKPLTGKLYDHSPDHYILNQMPIAWTPDANCNLWEKTINEFFQNDPDSNEKACFLQEWFGYCLIPETRFHKFLWLVGSGANGKTLTLNILSSVVGVDNISSAYLKDLDNKFTRAYLQNKLVNISAEMNNKTPISEISLKAITSGDSMTAEEKFKPPFTFRPFARLIGATNTLPKLDDLSGGFERRAIILTFNRVFKEDEQDRYLEENLRKELPGILSWAVEGLKRLLENDSFTIPRSSKEALGQYLFNSDPILQFVEDKMIRDEKGEIPGVIFRAYQNWAIQNGHKEVSKISLGLRLKELGYKKRKSNGQEFWNLKFKHEKRRKISLKRIG